MTAAKGLTKAQRTCVNPKCRAKFTPEYDAHIWCSHGCYSWIQREEIGISAAGMQPLGLMGDGKKIRAFNKKWSRIAGREAITPEKTR